MEEIERARDSLGAIQAQNIHVTAEAAGMIRGAVQALDWVLGASTSLPGTAADDS